MVRVPWVAGDFSVSKVRFAVECKDESSSNEFEMTVLSTKLMIGENQDNLLLSTNQSDNVGITNDSNDPISTSTNKGELLNLTTHFSPLITR